MDTETPNIMIIAVVQAQDAENASYSLGKIGAKVTKLPSVGGFLGRKNATLLISLKKGGRRTRLSGIENKLSATG